jgi:hypothetical protein
MSATRSPAKPAPYLLPIVIVLMGVLVAAFIVRTATLGTDAQRVAPVVRPSSDVSGPVPADEPERAQNSWLVTPGPTLNMRRTVVGHAKAV